MKINLKPNEIVIKAGDTKFVNGSDIPGKLIITNQRIYFIGKNISDYDMEIEPAEIKEVLPFSTLTFIPNGLNLITKDGVDLKFKVKSRGSWEKLINKIY